MAGTNAEAGGINNFETHGHGPSRDLRPRASF